MTTTLQLPDGWTEWTGVGEPPTGPMQVRLRYGGEFTHRESWAWAQLDWNHGTGSPRYDIVAYRNLADKTHPSHKMAALVDRFLKWKLPASVCSDTCVSRSGYPFERIGTSLLTADEARQMLEYVLTEETKP